MIDIYRETLLDHYHNPRNYGELKEPSAVHEEYNPFCGDKVMMMVKVEGDKLAQVRFSGEGCVISMATASMLTEAIQGKKIKYLRKLNKDDIVELLGIRLSPTRLKCALLPLEVLQKAVAKYNTLQARSS